MNLEQLLVNIDTIKVSGSTQSKVNNISFNSKNVKPGDVFVCISGFNFDGHEYAFEAIEKGAIAIVTERPMDDVAVAVVLVENSRLALAKMAATYYDYPFEKFKLIGVTGTNGKTTTTYLVKSVLESQNKKVGLIGTNQNMIGNTILPSSYTTPDSLELMRLFNEMAKEDVDFVVMEVSSHSLALDRVSACEFDIAAITNITQDHLDFHENMQNYMEAKSRLFRMCKTGILNKDDESFDYLKKNSKCNLVSYGLNDDAELKADNIEFRETGVEFDIIYSGRSERGVLSIPGKFSVYNALTAIGCCLALGFTLKQVLEGLKSAKGVKGRIEVVETNFDYTVIIDYAHTPDGLLNIINTIRDFAKGRVITLFGCGGDRDKKKRPIMGKIAGELSDFCIVTSDNPRTEEPMSIIEDILVGMKGTNCDYVVIENRFEAIEYALDHAQKNDIILLAGKGHETYQVLKERTINFDEREIVSKLLDSSLY